MADEGSVTSWEVAPDAIELGMVTPVFSLPTTAALPISKSRLLPDIGSGDVLISGKAAAFSGTSFSAEVELLFVANVS